MKNSWRPVPFSVPLHVGNTIVQHATIQEMKSWTNFISKQRDHFYGNDLSLQATVHMGEQSFKCISLLQVFKKDQCRLKNLRINLQLAKKMHLLFAAANSTRQCNHTIAVFLQNGQQKQMHYIFENTSCFHCFRQKSGKPKTGKPKLIMAVKNYSLIKICCILIGVLFFHGLPNIS